jgi:hypothetical protein
MQRMNEWSPSTNDLFPVYTEGTRHVISPELGESSPNKAITTHLAYFINWKRNADMKVNAAVIIRYVA